jgi:hypothetical protein
VDDIVFMFAEGPKRARDMTREELLEVIDYMLANANWWTNEAKTAFSFGDLMVVRSPADSAGPNT